MIGIYKIENLINHHCYIGQSVDIENRWKDHRIAAFNKNQSTYDYPIYRAMRKYGLNNFSFEILETCPRDELNTRETYWIGYYHAFTNGYNQTIGGQNTYYPKLQPQEINEIKERLIHFKDSDTHRAIAEDYHVSIDTIQAINNGRAWYDDKLTYPLHESKYACYSVHYYTCVDCGKSISKGATRCNACASALRRKELPITRDELKQLIRTTPFTTIAKQFNLSDNAIRKWCDKYSLPRHSREIKHYSDEEWELI